MQGGKRKGAGRPTGTKTGKKERITINIEDDNLEWLKAQGQSYSKVVNRLILNDRWANEKIKRRASNKANGTDRW